MLAFIPIERVIRGDATRDHKAHHHHTSPPLEEEGMSGWLASHQARALREAFDFDFLFLLYRFVLSRQPGAVKANMFEHVAA